MDPISALSLAANVIQVVDFGIDCIQGCKTLYERGSRDEDGTIELHAESIVQSNKTLQDVLKQQRMTGAAPARLLKIASEAFATADELRIEVNKLKLSKSQGVRRAAEAFKITLKAVMKSGRIDKLQKRLEAHDKALKSGLVREI
jgi:hypothetical protein